MEIRTNPIDSDMYLLNLNSSGAYVGVDTFAGTNRDVGLDLQVGSDGSLYIAEASEAQLISIPTRC